MTVQLVGPEKAVYNCVSGYNRGHYAHAYLRHAASWSEGIVEREVLCCC